MTAKEKNLPITTSGIRNKKRKKRKVQAETIQDFVKDLELAGFIEANINVKEFIHFDPNVGVDGGQFIGIPGSGKTSLAHVISKNCLKEKEENLFMDGDLFCEWRHFLRYPRIVKKIHLFFPKNIKLHYHKIPTLESQNHQVIDCDYITNKYKRDDDHKTVVLTYYVDLDTLNILDYLSENTKQEIFVIYTEHFAGDYYYKRAEIWNNIFVQLLRRTVLIDSAQILLFNEGGVLWEEGSSDEHWDWINTFSKNVVQARKGLIRLLIVSQLETEVLHKIRKKLFWKFYKFGTTASNVPKAVKSSVPFMSRSAYTIVRGGLYIINNQASGFTELKEKWKIIPLESYEPPAKEGRISKIYPNNIINAIINEHTEEGKSINFLSKKYNISRETITNWREKLG